VESTFADSSITFAQLGCSDAILRALVEMGFDRPTVVQERSWGPLSAGRDLMMQSRTGSGKTAAFGIPIIDKQITAHPSVQALVLEPTRELALQVTAELEKIGRHRGIKPVAIYGGAAMGKQVADIRAGAQIVVGTPGRTLDHIRRGTLKTGEIRVLVLDEADEMLSMGFEKELRAILAELPASRQTILLSATIPADIQELAERHMHEPEFLTLSSDHIAAQEIRHFMYLVSGAGRTQDLLRILEIENPTAALLFCNTREETQLVARALKKAGWNAEWLSSDLSQAEREVVMQSLREGKVRFVVATDVAARGIDVSHLSHVINVSFPESLEVYVHRTGRTGRMGRAGTAISLISPRDLGNLYLLRLLYKINPIERELPGETEERTRREVDQLESLLVDLSDEPGEEYRALARRVAVHVHGERVFAALLRRHFEGRHGRVDEVAASRRAATYPVATEPRPAARSAPPAPAPRPAPAAPTADAPAAPAAVEATPAPSDRGRSDRDRDRPRDRDRGPRGGRRGREERPRTGGGEGSELSTEPATTSRERAEELEFWERYRPARETPTPPEAPPAEVAPTTVAPVEVAAPEAAPTEIHAPADADASRAEDDAGPEQAGMTTVYVNVGRRDGVKASELARVLRERTGLGDTEIGKVRVRHRHTFVGVKTDRVDHAVTTLSGTPWGDKKLLAEPARGGRS